MFTDRSSRSVPECPPPIQGVNRRVEYFWTIGLLIVAIPVILLLVTRRKSSTESAGHQHDHGVTVAEPSSDQPTPGGENTINQPAPDAERRLPPG
jgi:hypothetical protein